MFGGEPVEVRQGKQPLDPRWDRIGCQACIKFSFLYTSFNGYPSLELEWRSVGQIIIFERNLVGPNGGWGKGCYLTKNMCIQLGSSSSSFFDSS